MKQMHVRAILVQDQINYLQKIKNKFFPVPEIQLEKEEEEKVP